MSKPQRDSAAPESEFDFSQFELNRRSVLFGASALAIMTGCQAPQIRGSEYPSTQLDVESFSPEFKDIVDLSEQPLRLAEGFLWTEGPAWDTQAGRLYFSDIPNNRILSWSSKLGLQPFLSPAGRPEALSDPHASPGTNGILYIESEKSLIICNQDGRSVDRLDLDTNQRTPIAFEFEGKKFNSPYDVTRTKSGVLFFTDPPYGLKDGNASAGKEQASNGVYRLDPNGTLSLVTAGMTFPNGIALSPDARTLYVSQSDPNAPIIMAFELDSDARASRPRLWADLSRFMAPGAQVFPAGMAVDVTGRVFATGPGGVFVIAPTGDLLGRIRTDRATANCAFGEDGRTLFMTAHQHLLSIRTKTVGLGFA